MNRRSFFGAVLGAGAVTQLPAADDDNKAARLRAALDRHAVANQQIGKLLAQQPSVLSEVPVGFDPLDFIVLHTRGPVLSLSEFMGDVYAFTADRRLYRIEGIYGPFALRYDKIFYTHADEDNWRAMLVCHL